MATAGAIVLAPMLSPNARAVLFGIALLAAAAGMVRRPTDPPPGNRFAILWIAAGDRTAFLAFAIGMRSAAPALAGIGALAGALALTGAATMIGSDAWRRLPRLGISRAAAALFASLGCVAVASGLRLI